MAIIFTTHVLNMYVFTYMIRIQRLEIIYSYMMYTYTYIWICTIKCQYKFVYYYLLLIAS